MKLNNEIKYLVASTFAIVLIFIIAFFIDQKNYPIADNVYLTDTLFYIIPIIVIILGIILSLIYKGSGSHGKAWILFTIFVFAWLVGDTTFDHETEYNYDDITTLTTDIFYIFGYLIFFAFTILYLLPRRHAVTKNIVLFSVFVSLVIIIPTLYITFEDLNESDNLTLFFYIIYPVLDVLILIPSIVAVILFFRGQVNFLWTLVLIATLFDTLANLLFILFIADSSYYKGHPVDMLYLFSYTLYAFGVYSHIKLYRNSSK